MIEARAASPANACSTAAADWRPAAASETDDVSQLPRGAPVPGDITALSKGADAGPSLDGAKGFAIGPIIWIPSQSLKRQAHDRKPGKANAAEPLKLSINANQNANALFRPASSMHTRQAIGLAYKAILRCAVSDYCEASVASRKCLPHSPRGSF